MPAGKIVKSLSRDDHAILLNLIRGMSQTEVSLLMGMSEPSMTKRLRQMRRITETKTTYQLVALEVINLLDYPETEVAGIHIDNKDNDKAKAAAA